MSEEPMGMLYFSNALYGEDMTRLREALQDAGFDLNIDPLEDQADLVKLEDGDEDEDTTLTLEGLTDDEVMAVLGGVSTFQMQALAAQDIPKVAAAGNTLGKLAEQNPEPVRKAFLENAEHFRVMGMPDELLDHLDLEVRDGKLYRRTDEDDFVEVDIE